MACVRVSDDELIAFLRGFLADNDNFPNAPTIAHRFGWASINAAYERMLKLERRGVIERNTVGGWRFKRQSFEEQLVIAKQVMAQFRGLGSAEVPPQRSLAEVAESQRKLAALLFGSVDGDAP